MQNNASSPPQVDLVELSLTVDVLIRYNESTADRQTALTKELFRQKNHFFMFSIRRSGEKYQRTLKELSARQFYACKKEFLSKRPYSGCEFWNEDEMSYKLKCYVHHKWKALVDARRCFFLNKEDKNNRVLDAYNDALKKGFTEQKPPVNAPVKRYDSPVFVHLSEAYDVDYQNVVCLGGDPQKLKNFQQTYQEAIAKVSELPITEQNRLQKNLSTSQSYAVLKSTIKELGIDCGNANLRQMNFSKIIFVLKESTKNYRAGIVDQAIAFALSQTPEEQNALYQRLVKCSKKDKKIIWQELGINTEEVDVKKLNIVPLKIALAKSLGLFQEKT